MPVLRTRDQGDSPTISTYLPRADGFPTDGLVAAWKMDEGAGATRVDSHQSYDLSDTGTVGSDAIAKDGNAGVYSTGPRYLSVPDAAPFRLDHSWTFGTWIRPTNNSGYQTIAAKWHGTADEWFIRKTPSSQAIEVGLNYDGGTNWFMASGGMSVGFWNLIFVAFNLETSRQGISLSGSNFTWKTGLWPGTSWDVSDSPVNLGRDIGAFGGQLQARLDESWWWDRILTVEELTWMLNYTGPPLYEWLGRYY